MVGRKIEEAGLKIFVVKLFLAMLLSVNTKPVMVNLRRLLGLKKNSIVELFLLMILNVNMKPVIVNLRRL